MHALSRRHTVCAGEMSMGIFGDSSMPGDMDCPPFIGDSSMPGDVGNPRARFCGDVNDPGIGGIPMPPQGISHAPAVGEMGMGVFGEVGTGPARLFGVILTPPVRNFGVIPIGGNGFRSDINAGVMAYGNMYAGLWAGQMWTGVKRLAPFVGDMHAGIMHTDLRGDVNCPPFIGDGPVRRCGIMPTPPARLGGAIPMLPAVGDSDIPPVVCEYPIGPARTFGVMETPLAIGEMDTTCHGEPGMPPGRFCGDIPFPPAFGDVHTGGAAGDSHTPPAVSNIPIVPARRFGIIQTPPAIGEVETPPALGEIPIGTARRCGNVPTPPAIGEPEMPPALLCGIIETPPALTTSLPL